MAARCGVAISDGQRSDEDLTALEAVAVSEEYKLGEMCKNFYLMSSVMVIKLIDNPRHG